MSLVLSSPSWMKKNPYVSSLSYSVTLLHYITSHWWVGIGWLCFFILPLLSRKRRKEWANQATNIFQSQLFILLFFSISLSLVETVHSYGAGWAEKWQGIAGLSPIVTTGGGGESGWLASIPVFIFIFFRVFRCCVIPTFFSVFFSNV